MALKKRKIEAEDLYRLQLISGSKISPDGRHVIFSLQHIEKKTEKKYSNLWVASTVGKRVRQFTYGNQVDSQPKWSPDGKEITFLSNRADEKQSQLYLIPFHGGEARQLTNLKGSIKEFEWSPDGKKIVISFQKKDPEVLEREKDEKLKKLGIRSRHITRTIYKFDSAGYLPKERTHIWAVDARSGLAKQLTDGPTYDETSPTWSPDGKYVAFCSNRAKDPDLDLDAIDIFLMPAKGGRPKKIKLPFGAKTSPSFSPDGKHLAYVAREGRGNWWRNNNLWVTTLGGRAKNLTKNHDITVDPYTVNDLTGFPEFCPPIWSPDSKSIYFQTAEKGNAPLRSINLKGDTKAIIDGSGVVSSISFDQKLKKLAYFYADMKNPGEIWVRDLKNGQSDRLTKINDQLLKKIKLSQVEEIWCNTKAGRKLQGWIMKPVNFNSRKKYPSILEIHGGPLAQYGNFFMHEFYYLAAQGYVVYFTNPRGSTGYGETHAKAINNNWGTADYEDVMAWANFVARKPYIDKRRMGVTGGSYGGFMTNWIIGNTNRFKAAVTQRCVSNLISMWGSSDYNWVFQQELGNKPPWKALNNYWRQSPMKHIGKAKTPTLVIHSENDLRCDQEQGEQIYVALKTQGVDTEMVLFPDESHGLSRGGRTDRRIERLNHILRWFDRYLK